MFRISRDTPAYYLTSVTNDRLPVFRTIALKELVCEALNEGRTSAGLLLLAGVIMIDHLHVIVASQLKPSKIVQQINGITARRVIDFLKTNAHWQSLEKLKHADRGRRYRFSLWDHHPNTKILTNESVLMQKVNYLHQNPVRAGLVQRAEDYRWSTVRHWKGCPLENEPLLVDLSQVGWHSSRNGGRAAGGS